ncbi:sulfate adenylyltransferase subunit CysN [Buchnera aphidicola (Thelaxes californica)]|uniref:sulfate adenylyltransferase n=1 Tax=Buchnera aphidicola (Thelaxes californica) TaxID=1315998 RepID=A0A4D6YBV4_9GAMM|nr:sulfate adenylyltransferase subunit CysN [Buchnera aphidicola]QCI26849.1 sulfate adenylyltransferase subunit CysN [Buchnera aphidicola (Thelaxes californica)]
MSINIYNQKKHEILNLEWMNTQNNKKILRFLTCGSVDDGKSTLIGRLLYDTKQIYTDQLDSLRQDSKKHGTQGKEIDYALLVDGLQAEREQGITIDVAYRYFYTKNRKFIISDTPGHAQYTCNMVTGASTCDVAILLIDVKKGLMEQTFRHAFITTLLGIRHIIVTINKMDLIDYNQNIFNKIKHEFINFSKNLSNNLIIYFIPISALNGENVVTSHNCASWYTGMTLLQILENIEIKKKKKSDHLILPIQYVNRTNSEFRGYTGTVSSGKIFSGKKIKVLPNNLYTTIDQLISYDNNMQQAYEGDPVTVTIKNDLDITRGDVLVDADSKLIPTKNILATIVWMSTIPLSFCTFYDIKIHCKKTRGMIKNIQYKIDITNLHKKNATSLCLNEIGLLEIFFDDLVICDSYVNNKNLGSFIIIDPYTNATIGAGMVQKVVYQNKENNDSNRMIMFEQDLKKLVKIYFPHWKV